MSQKVVRLIDASAQKKRKKVRGAKKSKNVPLLSLMKYSTYFKKMGWRSSWTEEDPDTVVGCILYDDLFYMAEIWRNTWPDIPVIIGGPGYDPSIMLPREVERCSPDYSIYPDYEGSIGRVTIGCPNKCYFCKVPYMKAHWVQRVQDFYRGGTCRLLDDNILAPQFKEAWKETVTYLTAEDIPVTFDALDFRFLTPGNVVELAELNHQGKIHFAFDMIGYKDKVIRGVKMLEKNGIPPYRLMVYVYLHNEAHIPDAMKRWEILRELGTEPYLMVNSSLRLTKKLRRIRRKGDSPAVYRKMTTKEVFS